MRAAAVLAALAVAWPMAARAEPSGSPGSGEATNTYQRWRPATVYGHGEIVADEDALWVALSMSRGSRPAVSPARWRLLRRLKPKETAPDMIPRWLQTRLSFEAELWPAQDAIVGDLTAVAQIRLARNFSLFMASPLALGAAPGDSRVLAAPGNEQVGFHLGWMPRYVSIGTGLIVSMPTIVSWPRTNGALDEVSIATFAAVADELVGIDRFLPMYAFLRFPFDLEVQKPTWFTYHFQVSVLAWLPTLGGMPAEGGLESWSEFEFRLGHGLTLGGRITAVLTSVSANLLTLSGFDVGFEEFIGFEPRAAGVFGRLGVLEGLNGPFAQPYDSDYPIVVHASIGYEW